MENKNLKFFSDSYKYDINILNNLQILLIQNQINKEFTLDHSLHSFLEEPFVGKNYVSLNEENFNVYSNDELVRSLNDLIKDYTSLLELFGKVNEERKVLRKNNIALLQKLFSLEYGLQSPNESDFQNYLNKIIFLNQEFLKKYVLILEDKLSQTITQRDSKDSDLIQMKSQIEKLEKKLISSRENLKQYLITGKADENTSINGNFKMHCFQSVTNIPILEDFQNGESTESPTVNNNNNINEVTSMTKISQSDNAIGKPKGLTSKIQQKKIREYLKTEPIEKTNTKQTKLMRKSTMPEKQINTFLERKSAIPVKSKTFLKKSSIIEFNSKSTGKTDGKDLFKKPEKKEKNPPNKLSMSLSTADFSNFSKKTDPRKKTISIHSTKNSLVGTESTRTSIKKNIKNP